MKIFSLLFAATFCLTLAASAPKLKKMVVKEFKVEPDTAYTLTFKAETRKEVARWELLVFNAKGELPYWGCLSKTWQTISPGRKEYRHTFRTPSKSATLRFICVYEKTPPRFETVELRKIADAPLVLNGDFSGGPNDYSGWNERYMAHLIEKDGKTIMKVDNNGYVLTDFIPVVGEGKYKFAKKAKTGSLYAYDSNRHFISAVSYSRKQPIIVMPPNAAYVRIFYKTWWDHLPVYRTIVIPKTGLLRVDSAINHSISKALPQSKDEIVLASNCDPREERAALELQYWLGKITGRNLSLLAEPSKTSNLKIFIGSAWASQFNDDLKLLAGSDGYAARKKGNAIHIFGATPHGTLFGVYAFLEKNTGIIWPRPNPKFEAFFKKQPDLKYTNTNFRSKPVFEFRGLSFAGHGKDSVQFQQWNARNGLNTSMRLGKGFHYMRWRMGAIIAIGGGYISNFVGKNLDDKFYSLIDGKRSRSVWRQPCYTYPKVVDVIARNIRKKLKCLPGRKIGFVMCRIADNWSVCACPECMKPIKLPDGSLLKPKSPFASKSPLFFSTRNFIMLNKIADKLTEEFPTLRLITHAYIFTAEPPKVKVNPIIIPQFAAYPTQNARYPILAGEGSVVSCYDKNIWKRRFTQWGKLVPSGLGWFGYYNTPGFNALADTVAADWTALADFGGVQAGTEGFPPDTKKLSYWDIDNADKWVIARLLWNPRRNPGELRIEFIRKVYGSAAPEMREFHSIINKIWHDPKNKTFVNCHSSSSVLFEGLIVKTGLEKRLRALLVKAVEKANDPKAKEMISRQLRMFDKFAATLERREVPYVDEATAEWTDPVSTHWEKAVKLKDFKKVSDWRVFRGVKAKHQTIVAVMRDKNNIYLRFTAFDDHPDKMAVPGKSGRGVFPNGDRVEFIFKKKDRGERFFAVGPNGAFYAYPPLKTPWSVKTKVGTKSWTALVSIPLAGLNLDTGKSVLPCRFCRVYRLKGDEREESTLRGISMFNSHISFLTKLHLNAKGK